MSPTNLLSRRSFLAAAGAAGLIHAYPREAKAAATELTVATWGAGEIKDLTAAFAKPFTNETGTRVLFDGAGPSEGKIDRKSTRLNSSHSQISYAVFCLKKKNNN